MTCNKRAISFVVRVDFIVHSFIEASVIFFTSLAFHIGVHMTDVFASVIT